VLAALFGLGLACATALEATPPALAPDSPEAGCIACHASQASELRFAPFHREGARGYGCLVCHLPHRGDPERDRGPSFPNRRCEDCHLEVLAQFALPFGHPLDGFVGCTSCHPAHGLPRRENREHTRSGACVSCHLEMGGPWVFDHEGDRNFGCLSCHEPHGSSNRRLLTHATTQMLCMTCHAFLDLEHLAGLGGGPFSSCLNCHTEIHGSYYDRHFLR
jgi:DmsE family decaheme c-type cytochrome